MRLRELESDPVGTIMSVAKVATERAKRSDEPGKMNMQAFLNMLKNSGLPLDYEGFADIYNTNPELKTTIQQFNDDEVVFVDDDAQDQEGLSEPQGDVPPEKKVNQMAKAALAKREDVDTMENDRGLDVSMDNEEENPVAGAILWRLTRQHPQVFMKYDMDDVLDAVNDVAGYVGDVEEIGSSDVSIWTREVLDQLGGVEEDSDNISRLRKLSGLD